MIWARQALSNPSDPAAHPLDLLSAHSKVLSNADRLLLLFELSQGEMCVSELEKTLDIRQPMLSQKLAALRADGVVKTRREGNRIFYSVVDPKVMHLL